jgi:oligopeptide/dipeptide ABC transporter ATP-binding protein
MSRPLLEVRNLRKYFDITQGILTRVTGHVHAIEDVSFSIGEKEILGLAGESGSGKTTIGRTILRLIEPTAGQVIFDGKDIIGIDTAELRAFRRSAQIVFQDPFASIDPMMKIEDVVGEPLRVQKIASGSELSDRVRALLSDVSLPTDFMKRRPGELSGGQRQRVVIARALAMNPRFIVADEPVSALDVSIQAQIICLLEELKEKHNLTMLFISHDLAVMEYLSDRIGVVYLGRIMEIGPSRSLVSDPQHPYTQALISAVPDNPAGRARIILQGDAPDPVRPPSGCVFRLRCPYAIGVCSEEVPTLREVSSGHLKACLRDDIL